MSEVVVEGAGIETAKGSPGPWPTVVVQRDLRRARSEWLHTNGAGAYASSTVAGLHTRRYHGLLVAALDPPCGRHVFLSHVDATVTMASGAVVPSSRTPSRPRGASWELAKHQFPGVDPEVSPFHLERFDQDPLPRWTYRVAGGELEVTLALVRGENAVVLRYAFRGPEPIRVALRPLLATRDFHHLLRENGGMLQRIELRPGGDAGPGPLGEMRVQPRRELPRICFRYEGTFVGSPDWWRRFEYLAEQDRGLDYQEDLWTPGLFEITVDGAPRYLVAAVDKLPAGEPAALLEAARAAVLAEDPGDPAPGSFTEAAGGALRSLPSLVRGLSVAAEVFRADLARRPGVITGYPWLEVGARDTLVALPGLYLVTGKIDGALRILREMIDAMADGLVPDHVADAGHDGAPPDRARASEPRTADTTLWLFEAARHVADALGDQHRFVTDELLLALRDAFEAVLRGTRDGTHLTAEGLFAAGQPGDALTWMDARVDGKAVTSRAGCPVELTALWARGCDTLARLARAAGDLPLHERAVAERGRSRRGFRARFWCAETGYPYDVVEMGETPKPPAQPLSLPAEVASPGAGVMDDRRDARVRPNAVLALAVDPECFTAEQASLVLARAERDLVTPAGLRTLAPGEPGYLGRYAGGVAARDGAHHQGTVSPWLLGPYVRASLRRGADPGPLAALVASAAGNALAVGQVPELADGDAPHAPAGCVAQAWSVAELLRAAAWDLGARGPT